MPYPVETIPLSYNTPPFPSLYWPIKAAPGDAQYLYYESDIWRFTLYWTLISFTLVHLPVSLWAVLMQIRSAVIQHRHYRRIEQTRAETPNADDQSIRSSRATIPPQPLLVSASPILSTLGWVWIIPVVYLFIGGIEALLSGSLVGLIVGALYNAGYFKMSTWMPFLWGVINCLVVILGSFRIQGGL